MPLTLSFLSHKSFVVFLIEQVLMKEVLIQTSLHFIRANLNITTDKIKNDIHNNYDCTSRHDTDDNSDHVKLCTNNIFEILCFKLQAYTNLFPISVAFPTLFYTITSLITVTERIHKGLNLSHHQSLTAKANIH